MSNATLLIERYGVRLRRLQQRDIEMLRRWRTAEKIQSTMAFRGDITPEQQRAWFASIDQNRDYYFIVVARGEEIGMVDVKHIDWTQKVGEGGIFIYSERYQNSIVPYCALVGLLEFAFDELGLERVTGQILGENLRATRFAESLGYRPLPDQDAGKTRSYELSPDAFRASLERIRPMIESCSAKFAALPTSDRDTEECS